MMQQQQQFQGVVTNPFAYRSYNESNTKETLPLHEQNNISRSSSLSATTIAKILTFVLVGFAAGLYYHVAILERHHGHGDGIMSIINNFHHQVAVPLFSHSSNTSSSSSSLSSLDHHEQMLMANDHIVHQLAAENQQHQEELARLREQLQEKQQQQTQQTQLRKRRQQPAILDDLIQQQAHRDEDKHAILWSHEVHEARLQAAHEEAEALLRRVRHR